MKIKRSIIEQMIKEELANHIREMMEGPKEDDAGAKVVDAAAEKKDKKKDKEDDKPTDTRGPKPKGTPGVPDAKELPVEDDPEADPELEKDVAKGEEDDGEEEDAEEVTGGKIADQITGKTVQSVTMEPKSKTLPGAQELVITFREIPDPLKVLITKTGQVKFFFKGLHNEV